VEPLFIVYALSRKQMSIKKSLMKNESVAFTDTENIGLMEVYEEFVSFVT
jgi:hypothetical protein